MRCLACVLLTGCSIVYNPDHLNRTDDATTADVEIVADVDATKLKLTDAWPAQVFEGAGTGGARPALVVIYGHQIAPDAVVTLTPMAGDPNAVKIVNTTIAGDHNFIALSLEVDDDATDNDGTTVPIAIGVSQAGGAYSDALDPAKLSLVHLDALGGAPAGAVKALYSQVTIPGALALAADATAGRFELHAVGGITVGGKLSADANAQAPGPGGCAGGAAGVDGATQNAALQDCTGRGHSVATGVLSGGGGGGAGFVVKGEAGTSSGGLGGDAFGTPQVADLGHAVPSGGGGGGKAATGTAGAGGGGGGAIALVAGGDITLSAGASANGGKGVDTNGAGGGGGGDGGVIMVRAGGNANVGTLDVLRGEPGVKASGALSGNAGGPGSAGRTRVDAQNAATAGYQGPMFVAPPAVSLDQATTLQVRGAIGETTVTGQVFDRDGNLVDHGSFNPLFNGTGLASPSLSLKAGYNRVCVTVAGGNAFTLPESTNCTEIAFLPH